MRLSKAPLPLMCLLRQWRRNKRFRRSSTLDMLIRNYQSFYCGPSARHCQPQCCPRRVESAIQVGATIRTSQRLVLKWKDVEIKEPKEGEVANLMTGSQVVKDAVLKLNPLFTKNNLLVSVAAGVKLHDLQVGSCVEIGIPMLILFIALSQVQFKSQEEIKHAILEVHLSFGVVIKFCRIVVILKLIQQSQRLVPDEIQLSQVLDFSLHPQELKSVSYNTIYHSIRQVSSIFYSL
ncbi:hypothetical protein AHAS_Ahas07G0111300 [Arachis hypogaea]